MISFTEIEPGWLGGLGGPRIPPYPPPDPEWVICNRFLTMLERHLIFLTYRYHFQ